ncbi:hypothetical protein QPL79_01460 [Ignisphaera sp. 4213-co]|uniref:Uncharacterized protein n=1 Tax=Ignisphaera cupida TaxID=3050454 RepID=A0ABD4Z515_9CREN|nr:hypothetical protein [Ignisphaera sp. 4213-co]MDK6028033.1 hypothetical protein [Ignisphaera sp. 4213-co]
MFLSSGKLVKNPQLIHKYLDELRKRGLDPSILLPSREDIDLIENSVKKGLSMLKIMDDLINNYLRRIDPVIAKKVFKEVTNEDVDEETAAYLIAKELSAWTLEIAEALNIIMISDVIR